MGAISPLYLLFYSPIVMRVGLICVNREMLMRLVTILALLFAPPVWARDIDAAIHLSFLGDKISVSYRYDGRDIADSLVRFYCQNQFGKKADLGSGACTKMMPMEANPCKAGGLCQVQGIFWPIGKVTKDLGQMPTESSLMFSGKMLPILPAD